MMPTTVEQVRDSIAQIARATNHMPEFANRALADACIVMLAGLFTDAQVEALRLMARRYADAPEDGILLSLAGTLAALRDLSQRAVA